MNPVAEHRRALEDRHATRDREADRRLGLEQMGWPTFRSLFLPSFLGPEMYLFFAYLVFMALCALARHAVH